MRKLFVVIAFSLLLWGCDSIPDGVVDSGSSGVEILYTVTPSSIVYTDNNTNITAQVKVSENSVVEKMWFDIISNDGQLTIASSVPMKDNGDTDQFGDAEAGDYIYSGKFFLDDQNPNGEYSVEIYLRSGTGNSKKVAVNKFKFDNAQDNVPPVISDLIAPDTVVVQDPKSVLLLSLKATDENGLLDIQSVYFTSIRPDGTSSGTKFFLYDDGNIESHGDENAGDGRYSTLVEVTPSNQKGEYKFIFQAQDRGGKLSNELIHSVVLQ